MKNKVFKIVLLRKVGFKETKQSTCNYSLKLNVNPIAFLQSYLSYGTIVALMEMRL